MILARQSSYKPMSSSGVIYWLANTNLTNKKEIINLQKLGKPVTVSLQ